MAVLAHISTEYYVRLEQGRAPRPSSEVLAWNDLATALMEDFAELAPQDRNLAPGIPRLGARRYDADPVTPRLWLC
ncbi:hypothetical protein [Nonomuraea glycinis]|uniref:hypothetical protein n=1 Tax=Nonomuraea glycinis TaxID=2047744 RepID=UPI003F4B29E3